MVSAVLLSGPAMMPSTGILSVTIRPPRCRSTVSAVASPRMMPAPDSTTRSLSPGWMMPPLTSTSSVGETTSFTTFGG